MDLLPHIHSFLYQRLANDRRPLLLALSGGSDSLALLYLLLEYRKNHLLDFAIAHVNHGWRVESGYEAAQIQSMCATLGIPLHLKNLDPAVLRGNREAACRQERHQFFDSLCSQHGYQAVLLGHHADDLAETVFKRMLEGAPLAYLNSMNGESTINGLKIWRPLLEIKKKELKNWLCKKQLEGFDDHTNRDPKFLRSRLRTRIFPFLVCEFGKEIQNSLCFVAKEAEELRHYLNQKVEPYMQQTVRGSWGSYLDLSLRPLPPPLELRHLIRAFCTFEQFSLSREQLNLCINCLLSGSANKRLEIESNNLYIDRKSLFIQKTLFKPLPDGDVELRLNLPFQFGSWKIEMEFAEKGKKISSTCWKTLWKGYAEALLPKKNYRLGKGCASTPYPHSSPLGKWWTAHKVPAFLRENIPVLYAEDKMQHEFLTGKTRLHPEVEKAEHELVKIRFLFDS